MNWNRTTAVAVFAATVGFATTQSWAQDVTLRYSQWLPANYALQKDIIDPWIAEVERATEGRVKVNKTPKVVGTVAGQYDVIVDGLADIALIVPGYTPGRFPYVEGMELPFLGDDPTAGSPVTQKTYDKFVAPTGEFKDIIVLSMFRGTSAHFVVKDKTLNSLNDVKGLKLRSPQLAVSTALELMGAVPITKPMSEVYELASNGTIDGGVVPLDTTLAFNLPGVLNKFIEAPGGLASTVVIIGMSPAAWEKIPAKDQEAIQSVSGLTLATNAGKAYSASLKDAYAKVEGLGMKVETISDEFLSSIKSVLAPIRTDWIKMAKEKGLSDPEAMLTFFETEYAAAPKADK